MAKKLPFLTTSYGAYHQPEVPSEDEELTRAGPRTPGGEYLRRFWQPVAVSHEVKDLPVAVKVMGEELVVFRDKSETVGVLQLHCSHRGTSLEFGIVSERGIRCCYHGWLYDVDGTILETPGEPPDSTLRQRLYHGAYPAREFGGIVFAYMGPPDRKPAFPLYDSYERPGYHLYCPGRNLLPCNWLQISENGMDPVHTTFLHARSTGLQGRAAAFLEIGTLDWMDTPIGMIYMHSRRVGDFAFVRMNDNILPNAAQSAPSGEVIEEEKIDLPSATVWVVPVDDCNTMKYRVRHHRDGEQPSYDMAFGVTADRSYEERQRKPGDYDAWVGQRSIAVHDLEHLGNTDAGVIRFRRMIRSGIQAVQKGEDAPGITHEEGRIIPTYCNNTVIRVPPAPTQEEDRELLLRTGRRLAESYLKTSPAVVKQNRSNGNRE
ncbi:MAG: aromatic ring-hydroxylating dioxygenase subunit alpha [Betaproteobacteria bacterium]|nr:aromatic ring-hydroxylating dioxygenase subunit alpha [Betaproteobacteria bacterium]